MAAVVALLLAGAAFFLVIRPLLGQREEIPEARPESEIMEALAKSKRELETDLQLDKIKEEDLREIESFLESSAKGG